MTFNWEQANEVLYHTASMNVQHMHRYSVVQYLIHLPSGPKQFEANYHVAAPTISLRTKHKAPTKSFLPNFSYFLNTKIQKYTHTPAAPPVTHPPSNFHSEDHWLPLGVQPTASEVIALGGGLTKGKQWKGLVAHDRYGYSRFVKRRVTFWRCLGHILESRRAYSFCPFIFVPGDQNAMAMKW